MIRADFIGAALRNRFGPFHHERVAPLADGSGGSRFDGLLAGGVIGT